VLRDARACVLARVRTSSALDNLGAASSADVSSYSVLKAMTLSPIRAIIHLSWLFSPLALSFLSCSPCRVLPAQFYPSQKKRERDGERGVDVTYGKRVSRVRFSLPRITNRRKRRNYRLQDRTRSKAAPAPGRLSASLIDIAETIAKTETQHRGQACPSCNAGALQLKLKIKRGNCPLAIDQATAQSRYVPSTRYANESNIAR